MSRAIIIRIDGTVELTEVELGYPGLNQVFGEGSLVERVVLPRLTDKFGIDEPYPILIVDEEGRVKGLPRNEDATRLYVPAPYRESHFIVGDALIIGEAMGREGAEFVALPERVTLEEIKGLIALFKDH